MSAITRVNLARLCAAALAATCALFSPIAQAESYANGTIKLLRTGWNADAFGIVLDQPVQNPAQCPTPDGYVTDAAQPGYETYYAFVLNAYRRGAPISVVIDSTPGACDIGRPKIIGINASPPPAPEMLPHQVTVVLRASGSWVQWGERRFSDVPVIGTFTGHGTDCSHGGAFARPPGPVSGPDVWGPAGWGQVEGNGHPDANSDACLSWVAYFGFDFDFSSFTAVPGMKSIDRAVLRYDEKPMPMCTTLVYTQGGFMVDSDIPCWSAGSGAPEDKPEGCAILRIPAADLHTVSMQDYWPLTEMKFNKLAPRGAWDVTELVRNRLNPGLIPPPEAGGPEPLGWGYALIGAFARTSDLDAEDNTRCTSKISDLRLELTFTVTTDQGGTPSPVK
jgi:hypothetical protein